MNGMMSFTGTMEEEFAHGSVGTMFLLMGLSWYLLSEYSGLQNGLLCFAIWAGFWIPTVVMGLRHLIRKAQQEVAEEGEKRLPWLRKQAAGAAIVAKQKREEGDDEAAEAAERAAADAKAEIAEIEARGKKLPVEMVEAKKEK
ncbi:hypothetical protein EMIHUDRAFT_216712 [Emiliania huxleyi CCMP1516]|uniref:Uncharacterized protein n=3 Tax=Emiliania huxleyi TaxID=2903 RepID=A0A0D3IDH6_EMIH1|nr:hypothetical protein EMIHUDRAFT_220896 [Emiliania huxleyi CCMP1516]XP_005761740.1 hypothetical protein EMIHUDRAFT_216712 [Emiliania huxleyi CCMP1516]EOD04744.1 hypothetical protein EMIHUDRAFT_220896 [Emiliania huxleyi CCMP1516]EOD09311.1 hypothetical protein EMIHUDRAFT_216712 [Emiliania huxleyi CCMP1516]|eukprot:XP_005757173.1 hypothetical protein EMIHUDRAFT_220896 [Emiliania huxleyi CCMP1516]